MNDENEGKKAEDKIDAAEAPEALEDEALDDAQGGLMSLNLNNSLNTTTVNTTTTNVQGTTAPSTLGGVNLGHQFKLRHRPGRF